MNSQQCQLCERLANALHPGGGYRVPKFYSKSGHRNIQLGSWSDLINNKECVQCSKITERFYQPTQDRSDNLPAANDAYSLHDGCGAFMQLVVASEDHARSTRVRIRPCEARLSHRVGALLDPERVNMPKVLQWLETCNSSHGHCHSPLSSRDASLRNDQMYLVDVKRMCLTRARSGDRYIALSYVWGAGGLSYKTLWKDVSTLFKEHSLSGHGFRQHLPGIVQRAMNLANILTVPYLWVDCLCIIHDDPSHFNSQIRMMAKIYSHAYLTVCAADGIDSESGLRGLPGTSMPRETKQTILAFETGSSSTTWALETFPTIIAWDQRGWTFQEEALSRRCLLFRDNQLMWRCQEGAAKEEVSDMEQLPEIRSRYDSFVHRGDTIWPDLKRWDDVLRSYLSRELTYEGDILYAFAGIEDALCGGFQDGFLYGLPEQFFDVALLWIPEEPLNPRVSAQGRNRATHLPSWSWAGWKGRRSNQVNAFGLEYIRSTPFNSFQRPTRGIIPCVTWHKEETNTLELVQITNSYAKYRKGGLDGTLILPDGWTIRGTDVEGEYFYHFDDAPSTYRFWYPLPMGDTEMPVRRSEWSPFLFCQTWRVYMELRPPVPGASNDTRQEDGVTAAEMIHPLYTHEGEWAGILYPHQPLQSTEQQCELILISQGFVEDYGDEDQYVPELTFEERKRSGDCYYFVNVLWIEWQGRFAFRKGVGRVSQEIWTALPKESLEVVLS